MFGIFFPSTLILHTPSPGALPPLPFLGAAPAEALLPVGKGHRHLRGAKGPMSVPAARSRRWQPDSRGSLL